MQRNTWNAISPIDGRYWSKTQELSSYFSEAALMRYRVWIEVEYFIALCELPLPQLSDFKSSDFNALRALYLNFSNEDVENIKEIERTTNHDVKAVEYFLKQKFKGLKLEKYQEFIHFGLTSQDINNTAIPLSIKKALEEVYLPHLDTLVEKLKEMASTLDNVTMLARTHGQAASPTRMGKEIAVFLKRLEIQKEGLLAISHAAKFGGATGNFNAHFVAYPQFDWKAFGSAFVEQQLGLSHSFPTTQIEHYDSFAALCDALKRINTILIDLDRDIWQYIAMDYFKQKIKQGEVGSSAMPHKVNPIDFENSEGNLGIANALFSFFAEKLPISRLQRDLTDSTVLRNVGVPFGHSIIALQATLKGLEKLVINETKIHQDLAANWMVVAEAIQTILRREHYKDPYEKLKELTRTHSQINKQTIHDFIDTLEVDDSVKEELKAITPFNYTGSV